MTTEKVTISVNGSPIAVDADSSVAAALLAAGVGSFRRSSTNEPRTPLCGMGICFECRVTIDGVKHQRSCMIRVREGMEVAIDA